MLTPEILTTKIEALKQEREALVGQANYTAGMLAGYEQILAELRAPENAPSTESPAP